MATQPPSKRLVTEEGLSTFQMTMEGGLPAQVTAIIQAMGLGSGGSGAGVDYTPLAPWEAALAARNISRPARVLFLGSSTIAGMNSTNPSLSAPALLLARIQAAYPSSEPGYEKPITATGTGFPNLDKRLGVQGYNSGVGGTTSANYYNTNNGPFVAWQAPNLVIHSVGSNDALDNPAYNVPPNSYQTNVAAAVDAIAAAVPYPVSQVLVHQHRRTGVTTQTWAQYGARLKTIAASRPNVMFIDLSATFERLDLVGTNTLKMMSPDGTHLSDAGHAFLAELLAQALRIPSVPDDGKTLVVDTFTRTNGPAYAAEGVGWKPWERQGVAVEAIVDRTLRITTGGSVVVDAGTPDYEVDTPIGWSTQPFALGIVFRTTDDANRMTCLIDPGGSKVTLGKVTAGVTATLQEGAYTFTGGGPHHLKVRAVGDRIWAYVDGVLVIDYTMTAGEVTAFGSATKVGVRQGLVVAGTYFRSFRVRRAA